MNAQTYVDRLSFDEYREWFQGEIDKLYGTSGSLKAAMGKRLQYAIRHCASDDIMPGFCRETLKEIGESVLFPETVEEPCTYAQGAKLLRKCLKREAEMTVGMKR